MLLKYAISQIYLGRYIFLMFAILCAHGCSHLEHGQESVRVDPVDITSVPDATPKKEQRSRYGNPKSYIVNGKRYYTLDDNKGFVEQGIASWYGKKFHGKRTSSGDIYDMYAMTAAHKNLILPVYVEVTNLENGKKVIVRVNDRGPFHDDRVIDLSYASAKKLGVVATGTAKVELRVVEHRGLKEFISGKTLVPVKTISSVNQPRVGETFIQVGAFSKHGNANALLEKLNVIGDQLTHIHETIVNRKTFYRVRIGPLFSKEAIDKMIKQLIQLNQYDHHIIVN